MDKRICDKCRYFEVSSSNTMEICHAKRYGSEVIQYMTDDYIELRFDGEKQNW